jgi:hypothetical protein
VVSSTVAFQRATVHVLQVELPTASTMASNPDPALGKENWPRYSYGGRRQKPGPVSSHVEGPLAMGDPPHGIMGDWLL